MNRKRVRRINVQEQFITAYGGLRGAVGFSLVEMIDSSIVPPKQMFVTTTLAVVMFTVFFQVSKFWTEQLYISRSLQIIYPCSFQTIIVQFYLGCNNKISCQFARHWQGEIWHKTDIWRSERKCDGTYSRWYRDHIRTSKRISLP